MANCRLVDYWARQRMTQTTWTRCIRGCASGLPRGLAPRVHRSSTLTGKPGQVDWYS